MKEDICPNCHKTFSHYNSIPRKYCSNKCQHEAQIKDRKRKVEEGVACWKFVSEYVKERANYRCEMCGLSEWLEKPIVLICDHIDGDHKNNSLDNLRAICSNCDSTLPTYKSRNRVYQREGQSDR